MKQVSAAIQPNDIIFVMDSHIGQACHDQATAFNKAVEICRNLSLKFTKDVSEIDIMIEKYAKNVMCLEMDCEHITGKSISEK